VVAGRPFILGSRRELTGCEQTENDNDRKKKAAKAQTAGAVIRAKGRGQVVEDILQKLEESFTKEPGVKATLTDYIRLLQLRRELGDEEPREIKVTWVDSGSETEKSESEE
jgi:hypothetical protein